MTVYALDTGFNHGPAAVQFGRSTVHAAGDYVDSPVLAIAYIVYMEERERQIALQQELESARELQQVLVPEAFPEVPGYDIQSVYQPATEVGGDFFQIIPQEDKSVIVALGDVSGKG